jgi:hypothetical protein
MQFLGKFAEWEAVMPSVYPQKESLLVPWSLNFLTVLSDNLVACGVSAPQITQLTTNRTNFVDAWNVCQVPATRTRPAISLKDDLKRVLQQNISGLAAVATNQMGMTNSLREELGLRPRDEIISPIPAPTAVPVAKIVSVNGWTTEVQITTAGSDRRGLPDDVAGINIYSFQGSLPPTDPLLWVYEGESSRSRFKLVAAPETPVGTKIFYTFCFKSPRFQVGPACGGVPVVVGGGVPETMIG